MPKQRVREKFIFWLTVSKDDELLIAEQIDELKHRRRFLPTIRDGIRLVCDLRQGRVDVLVELFPWVADRFGQPAASAEFELLLERMAELVDQQSTPEPPPSAGPRQLSAPPVAAPVFDDEDDVVLDIRAVQGGESAANFVSSVNAISGQR